MNHNLFLLLLIIKNRFVIIHNKEHIHFTDKPVEIIVSKDMHLVFNMIIYTKHPIFKKLKKIGPTTVFYPLP